MKLSVISHAYQDRRYHSALESVAKRPGIEVTLIHPESYKGKSCLSMMTRPFQNIPVPVQFGSRQGTFLYHPRALAHALDRASPGLILHEQEVYALGAGQIAAAAAKRSIPLVMFVWENVHRSLGRPRRILSQYVLARVSGMIAGSVQAMHVHREEGFPGPIEVIPQMSVSACPDPVYGRRDRSVLRVCFIGRLVASKGVDCLLRAVAYLHRRGFPISCTIAGEGPELSRLTSRAQELGIRTRIDFCGQLDEDAVQTLLRSSDVLVLPSRRTDAWEEQFGLVLTEAMAEATVTVGSRSGAIPEVIGSEELLFDEGDFQDLARVLERLGCDPHFYIDCQHRLWKRARDIYSADQLATQRVEFLRGILEEVRLQVAMEAHECDRLQAGAR